MNKLLNMVGMGLIFFSVFLIAFIMLFAYEHEVKALSLLGVGTLVTGLTLGALGNCRKS